MSSKTKKRALVVEFYDSHLETLIPQVYLLESAGYEVWVSAQNQFEDNLRATLPGRHLLALPTRGFWARWYVPLLVVYTLWRKGIRQVMINSPASNPVRRFLMWLWLLPRVQVSSVVHSTNRLKKGGSQRFFNTRIKRYWVLSQHQLDQVGPLPQGLRVGKYLPIIFEDPQHDKPSPSLAQATQCLSPGPDTAPMILAIPGHPDRHRRDYSVLFEALKDTRATPNQVQLWLLGNYTRYDGPQLLQEIESAGLTPWFRWGTHRIPDSHYYVLLQNCQAILPLLHPSVAGYQQYQTVRTSGNFNLAMGLQRPIALPEGFLADKDLAPWVVHYPADKLADWLHQVRPSSLPTNVTPIDLHSVASTYLQLLS